jgi:hypothetical protein
VRASSDVSDEWMIWESKLDNLLNENYSYLDSNSKNALCHAHFIHASQSLSYLKNDERIDSRSTF